MKKWCFISALYIEGFELVMAHFLEKPIFLVACSLKLTTSTHYLLTINSRKCQTC
jgi:hypothetical protein